MPRASLRPPGARGVGSDIHAKEVCMRNKRQALTLLGVMLLGVLAATAYASVPRVIMIESFDATT